MIKITLEKNLIQEIKKIDKYASKDLSRECIYGLVYLPKKKTIEATTGKALIIVNVDLNTYIENLEKQYNIIIVDTTTIALDERQIINFVNTDRIALPMDQLKKIDSFSTKGKKEVRDIELSRILYKLDACINYTYLQNLPAGDYQVYSCIEKTLTRPIVAIGLINLGSILFVAMPIAKL